MRYWIARFTRFLPLFLISAATIGFEVALTRYFAVANWSEYGYWVISIAMVGFSASGVVLTLLPDFFLRHRHRLFWLMPVLLMALAVAGFYFVTQNPFNPLELQNAELWSSQIVNIGKYYLALFPFFFCAGTFIGLCFLSLNDEIPAVYAADLVGAGVGALAILLMMLFVHPFYLLGGIIPLLLAAALLQIAAKHVHHKWLLLGVAIAVFAGSELFIVRFNQADYNQYKAIYPPLHVRNSQVTEEIMSPRGYIQVLDNFTERLNTDLSSNIGMMQLAGPPATYGVYRDGTPIGVLPKSGQYDGSYVRAALDGFPYALKPAAHTLLVGTRGGFRIKEALDLGAAEVTAIEPDASLFDLVRTKSAPLLDGVFGDPRVHFGNDSAAIIAAKQQTEFDIIDIASDFLNQADANKYAFTAEALRQYFDVLKPDGIVSIPVSIKELTVYAVKMSEGVRQALAGMGIDDPARHVMIYRSAWNVRIVVSKQPVGPAQIELLKKFCDERSFDISFFPGIEPRAMEVWNDLPQVSFDSKAQISSGDKPTDALAEESVKLFSDNGQQYRDAHFFNLEPASYDRPFFYSVLKLAQTGKILDRIDLIPREEIGSLVNLAVLAQAIVFATLVLSLPLFGRRTRLTGAKRVMKTIVYFASLGLGFLFIEILCIEKASFFLNDRTYAFALVLAGMLIFSGIGSQFSHRWLQHPQKGIRLACTAVAVWIVLAALFLNALMLAAISLPLLVKCLLTFAVIAPVSLFLGFAFPLGLSLFHGDGQRFVPWAWSLNGAFSVVSTPLANLLAVSFGYNIVLVLALLAYSLVYFSIPDASPAAE